MAIAWLCDFDGTIALDDIGEAVLERFSAGRRSEDRALLDAWLAGSVGARELIEARCALLEVREDEALEFVRSFPLDPSFPAFVSERRARGDQVLVVSDGLDFYVRDHLARAGLADLQWSANRLRFDHGRAIPEFGPADPTCDRGCGNCKAVHARSWRARGYRVALVGDGLSDRCGARAADAVYARDDLLAWCRREGVPALRFERFADVMAVARETEAGAAAAPATGERLRRMGT